MSAKIRKFEIQRANERSDYLVVISMIMYRKETNRDSNESDFYDLQILEILLVVNNN